MAEFDAVSYFTSLAQDAGVSQDELQAVLKVIKNDKIQLNLKKDVLARSDYSRQMDELKAQEKAIKDLQTKAEQEIANAVQWANYYNGMDAEYKAAATQLNDLKKSLGVVKDMDNKDVKAETGMTKAQVEQMLKEQMQAFAVQQAGAVTNFTKFLLNKGDDYRTRYGKRFDVDQFDKFMAEQKIQDPELAFERFIKPDEEARQKKEREDWEKKTREDLEREIQSKHPEVSLGESKSDGSTPYYIDDSKRPTGNNLR